MGANFKNMGPACCCCNNLYTNKVDTGEVYRHSVSGGALKLFDVPPFTDVGYEYKTDWGFFDFDPVHKKIFVSYRTPASDTPQARVSMLDEDFTNEVVLATVAGSDRCNNITTDSDNQRVFYLTQQLPSTTTRTLWTVNHDGTGNSSIGPITNDIAVQLSHPLHYCRANGKIYYRTLNNPGPTANLWRINADGSGDVMIAARNQAHAGINNLTIDNVNQRVLWSELTSFGGESARIFAADLDGAGVSTVYAAPPNVTASYPSLFTSILGVQWSHKNQRVYWLEYTSVYETAMSPDPVFTRKWKSCEIDGSNERVEVDDSIALKFPWGGGLQGADEWRIACGYETLGPGSPA